MTFFQPILRNFRLISKNRPNKKIISPLTIDILLWDRFHSKVNINWDALPRFLTVQGRKNDFSWLFFSECVYFSCLAEGISCLFKHLDRIFAFIWGRKCVSVMEQLPCENIAYARTRTHDLTFSNVKSRPTSQNTAPQDYNFCMHSASHRKVNYAMVVKYQAWFFNVGW